MRQIGFKNFRRFKDFPQLRMGKITILVGGNNAGKSTLVKGLLLAFNNLQTLPVNTIDFKSKNIVHPPVFRFDANDIHDLHIGTFRRALCSEYPANEICFILTLGKQAFHFFVKTNQNEDSTTGIISKIKVEDLSRSALFVLDYSKDKISFNMEDVKSKGELELEEKKEKYEIFKKELDDLDEADLSEEDRIIIKKKRLDTLKKLRKEIEETEKLYLNKKNKTISFEGPLSWFNNSNDDNVYHQNEVINRLRAFANKAPKIDHEKNKRKGELSLKDKGKMLHQIADEVEREITQRSIEYIYAHAATQKILFTVDDKNDYLAHTIHLFNSENISKSDSEYKMLQKWLEEFGIGNDIQIRSISGEAYTAQVIRHDKARGNSEVQFADLGMGSIQLIILLLRVVTIVHKYKERKFKPTIIIEEPEQNLHPAFQSKLADFFTEVYKRFRSKFIIETHSEYLIRKTQVLTFQEKYPSQEVLENESSYCVYYFPKDSKPYKMEYRIDGKFKNSFGKGFFDEASNLSFELL